MPAALKARIVCRAERTTAASPVRLRSVFPCALRPPRTRRRLSACPQPRVLLSLIATFQILPAYDTTGVLLLSSAQRKNNAVRQNRQGAEPLHLRKEPPVNAGNGSARRTQRAAQSKSARTCRTLLRRFRISPCSARTHPHSPGRNRRRWSPAACRRSCRPHRRSCPQRASRCNRCSAHRIPS